MRILFAGTPDVAAEVLRAIVHSSHTVVGVLTQPDARVGRGRKVAPTPVAELAASHEIPLIKPVRARAPEVREWVSRQEADAAVVVAYGQILDRPLLSAVTNGWYNLHFSLLPAFRGAAPVQRAIEAGTADSGMSVFRLDEGLDTGDVALVEPYRFGETETSGEALTAMGKLGGPAVIRVLDSIEDGTLELTPQIAHGESYATKIDPSERLLDPNAPGDAVAAKIRAFAPDPGVFVTVRGARLKLMGVGTAAPPEGASALPGEWIVTKRAIFLGTSTTPVHITMVAPAGKKLMNAADWARGLQLSTGDAIDPLAHAATEGTR